jgi:hypothetical protein
VHNAGETCIRYIVYQILEPNTGRIYSGMASGIGTAQEILARRFSGGHHTGLLLENAAPIWEGTSRAAARGLEHLSWARQQIRGNAFPQNNPISSINPRLKEYLEAAQDEIASGCFLW